MDEFEKMLSPKNEVIKIDIDDSKLKENEINTIDVLELQSKIKRMGEKLASEHAGTQQGTNGDKNLIKVQRNMILSYLSDFSGCSWVRNQQIMNYLAWYFGRTNKLMVQTSGVFIFQQDILMRCRALFLQRFMSPIHLNVVRKYREMKNQLNMGYSLIVEHDDFLFWKDKERTINGIPEYNFGAKAITNEVKNSAIEIMKLADKVVVSTEYLAWYIKNELKIETPITVSKNVVMQSWHKTQYEKHITQRIVRVKILITSSPTHYLNGTKEEPNKKLLGDFEPKMWNEYIIKNVKADKIDVVCMGGCPWFLEELKACKNFKVIEWLDSIRYSYVLKEECKDAHFLFMPLVPNDFSAGKSDLKAIEAMAAGVIPIGSSFRYNNFDGPYNYLPASIPWDSDISVLEGMIEKYSNPDEYNGLLDWGNDYMEKNGRYLESKQFIDSFLKII